MAQQTEDIGTTTLSQLDEQGGELPFTGHIYGR